MKGRVLAGWAALGVTLASATQLRMEALPLGPGEALLALWMAVFGFLLLRGMRFSYSKAFRPFAFFWALSAALLAAGSIVAMHLGKQDVETAQHDTLAFAFVGLLTCFLAIRVDDVPNERYYLNLARALFFTVSTMALLLLAASLVTRRVGPIDFWYGSVRFRGWSENPNQLALFMVPMPFLGLYLLKEVQAFGRKLAYMSGMVVCALVGLATDSDALKVAWVGAAGVAGGWVWCRTIVLQQGRFLQVAISFLVVPLVVFVMAIGFGSEIVHELQEIANQIYAKSDRGEEGMILLRHSLEAISHSPLVGFGPGAYSGMFGPFQGREAHNTLADWGTSTGMLGTALYLVLLFWCTVSAIRSGSPWLLGALVAMVIESVFGYSLRHPFFWLMLVLVITLSEQPARQMSSAVGPLRKSPMSAPDRPEYALTMRRSRRERPASATRAP